jgi:hypothetical protein
MSVGLILTNVPLNFDDVKLGSLVPNPKYPHQDACVGKAVTPVDYSARKRKTVSTRLDSTHDRTLSGYVTTLFSTCHSASGESHFELSAPEGIVYELRNPKTWFRELCTLPDVRTWLEATIDEGEDTYLVIGLRTLRDARITQHDQTSRSTELEAKAPVGEAVGAAVGGSVGGAADAGLALKFAEEKGKNEAGELEDERIYAVGFRRIKHHWYHKASVDTVILDSLNIWEPFSDIRTGIEDGKLLQVDIDDGELWQVAGLPEGVQLKIEEDGDGDGDYISLF